MTESTQAKTALAETTQCQNDSRHRQGPFNTDHVKIDILFIGMQHEIMYAIATCSCRQMGVISLGSSSILEF